MDPHRESQESRPHPCQADGALPERNAEPGSGEGAASAMARLQRQERNRLGRPPEAAASSSEPPA